VIVLPALVGQNMFWNADARPRAGHWFFRPAEREEEIAKRGVSSRRRNKKPAAGATAAGFVCAAQPRARNAQLVNG